ncbi:creatininase family protein, partial [Mesorhizobium sp. M1D.F.Ca.ET.234.01.1.1]|uniref:creatininase family protein n=1 Tax=Mesorhizobium sp. M1D.F.Ca.ET.234.01.1.1 TaxID=2563932 RepID=UPI0011394B30
IVVLNGHYENVWPSIEGIELALDAVGRDEGSGLSILRMDHWEFVRPQTIDQIFPNGFPGIELEHASVLETSLMLAIRPNQVDLGRSLNPGPAKFRPYPRFPRPPDEVPPAAVIPMTERAPADNS